MEYRIYEGFDRKKMTYFWIINLAGTTSHNAFRLSCKPTKREMDTIIGEAAGHTSSYTAVDIIEDTIDRDDVQFGSTARYKADYKLKDITGEYFDDPDLNIREII